MLMHKFAFSGRNMFMYGYNFLFPLRVNPGRSMDLKHVSATFSLLALEIKAYP